MSDKPGTENFIDGTSGNDVLVGTALDDRIIGRAGSDSADGLDGADSLDGGLGNDILDGGTGADWLIGGFGSDDLTGGTGGDQFRIYGSQFTDGDIDTVRDLDFAEGDVLVLAHFSLNTFPGSDADIPGEIDYSPSEGVVGGGANVLSWEGLAHLVEFSANVTAERGEGDDLILRVKHEGGSAIQTIVVTNGWTPYSGVINDAPVAQDDKVAVLEDAVVGGNVLANDRDPDGDTLTVSKIRTNGGSDVAVGGGGGAVIAGTYGALTIAADGTFSFAANSAAAQQLAAGVKAEQVFTYTTVDPSGAVATAQLTIEVTGTNDAPVAKALAGSVGENGPAITFSPDFTDIDAGDTHTTTVNTTGTKGSVVVNADGTFKYDPNGKFEALKAGQTATDTFTYTMTDQSGGTSTKSVTVTINGANEVPVAQADIDGLQSKGKLTVSKYDGVLSNDKDVDGGTLKVSEVNGSAANVGKAIVGTYGTLTLKNDGSYVYVATNKADTIPDKQVAQDIFTYQVSDGQGGTATSTLTITVTEKGECYQQGSDCDDFLLNIFGNSILDGGNGNDWLVGGFCDDGLIGGTGNDWLVGGFGKDTFVFNQGHGDDTIVDFGLGDDTIQFSKSVFSSYSQVMAASHVVDDKIVIDTGNGDSIVLLGHKSLGDLSASDFLFV